MEPLESSPPRHPPTTSPDPIANSSPPKAAASSTPTAAYLLSDRYSNHRIDQSSTTNGRMDSSNHRGQSSAFNGGDDGESSRRGTAKAKVSYAEQDEDDEDDILEDDEPVAPKKLVQTKIKLVVDPARARPTGAKPLVTTRTGVAADSGTDEDEEDQLDSDSQAESEEQEEDASDDYDDQGAGGAKGGTRTSSRSTRTKKSMREDGGVDSPAPKRSGKRPSGRAGSVDSEDDAADYEATASRKSSRSGRSSRKGREGSTDEDSVAGAPSGRSRVSPMKHSRKSKRDRDGSDEDEYGGEEDEGEDEDENAILKRHRETCEKCSEVAADVLQRKYKKKKPGQGNKRKANKRRDEDEDDIMSEGETIDKMGGWIECENCCVAAHFGCLSEQQRNGILKRASEDQGEKVRRIEVNQATVFLCGKCSITTHCFTCDHDYVDGTNRPPPVIKAAPVAEPQPTIDESAPVANGEAQFSVPQPAAADASGSAMEGIESSASASAPAATGDVEMKDDGAKATEAVEEEAVEEDRELLFRCLRCKRGCHFAHLVAPVNDPDWDYETPDTPVKLAEFYTWHSWTCHDCYRWTDEVDKVIAWRPLPANAVEKKRKTGEVPAWKDPLPREYLVKWKTRGFRHTEWVPHAWIQANSQARLRNFLTYGSQLQLLVAGAEGEKGDGEGTVADLLGGGGPPEERRESAVQKNQMQAAVFSFGSTPVADPEAVSRLPDAWRTFDRILDVYLHADTKPTRGPKAVIPDEDEIEEEEDPRLQGVSPYEQDLIHLDKWERDNNTKLDARVAHKAVAWCYVKCGDLPYSEATMDTPPLRSNVAEYAAYKKALVGYLKGREVLIPILTKDEAKVRDRKDPTRFKKLETQPDYIIGGQLMPFQLDGVNWLTYKWWELKSCILADDMGLGKTVQIAALIGVLGAKYKTFPTLIVVPNSTVTNWVREFEKWVPHIRVVPFHGEKSSKAIIEEFELFHRGTRKLKCHCVITTYDIITSASFKVLQEIPRWEMLVVDEGQRLKSDTNLIFQRLKILNCRQKVLLTGTPLNNNMRELFNLLSFLDPDAWSDLTALEKEFEDLDTEKVQELHQKLQPYFLRRIKADVLKLPPKHEIILPISLSKLQKEQYKALMLRNSAMIAELSAEATSKLKTTEKAKKTQLGSLNNLMMQLRKTCQHPYLVQPELEDRKIDPVAAHLRMTEASAKLTLLKLMLPRLRARGHRVLLFSQFKIALDIIQDWLDGENLPYIRLDGDTAQAQRQKDMDRFNAPDSDLFLYMLSTRAGGVGVNLATADTVIVFDPDFNPHQDLQAIARSYRFGQKKKVLVFKMMTKDTVEEKIFQKGRKKMVLDHLIVQNMSKEEDTDVQSMITFGAKALFEDEGSADINYSGHDVDELIKRVEETEEVEEEDGAKSMSFGFAKIWEASKAAEEDTEDNPDAAAAQPEDSGFWDKIVQRAAIEKQKEIEAMGRGAKRNRNKTVYAEGPPSPNKGHRTFGRGTSDSGASEDDFSEERDSDSAPESPVSNLEPQLPKKRTRRTRAEMEAARASGGPLYGPRAVQPTTTDPKTVLRAMNEIGIKIGIDSALTPLLQEATSKSVHPTIRKEKFDRAINVFVPAMHLYNIPTNTFVPHYPSVVRYLQHIAYPAGEAAQRQQPPRSASRQASDTPGPSALSAAASSSKRASPSQTPVDSPSTKEARLPEDLAAPVDAPLAAAPATNGAASSTETTCAYCFVSPSHELHDCRIIRKGPDAVATKLAALGEGNELYEPLLRAGANEHGKELSAAMAEVERRNADGGQAQGQ